MPTESPRGGSPPGPRSLLSCEMTSMKPVPTWHVGSWDGCQEIEVTGLALSQTHSLDRLGDGRPPPSLGLGFPVCETTQLDPTSFSGSEISWFSEPRREPHRLQC